MALQLKSHFLFVIVSDNTAKLKLFWHIQKINNNL